jgi:hypothetical protein
MNVYSLILRMKASPSNVTLWVEQPHTCTGGPVGMHSVEQQWSEDGGTLLWQVIQPTRVRWYANGQGVAYQYESGSSYKPTLTLIHSYTPTHSPNMHAVL